MLKKTLIWVLGTLVVAAIGAGAYTVLAAPSANALSSLSAGNARTQGSNDQSISMLGLPVSDLTADEAAGLLFMREEEKLALDVYTGLYALWGQPSFQNVAASEQNHMEAIKVLLDRYGLADPALDAGQFTNSGLQALYDQLVPQGRSSLAEALKVGAAIEEIDILDLQARLPKTDHADIQQVYNNLIAASIRHLQAFTSLYARQTGESYQPQYMKADQYETVIASANGSGNGNGNGNRNGGQGGSQGWHGYRSGSSGSGIPQANIAATTTVQGTANSYDLTGMSVTLDDGTGLYVQLGNLRYRQSIGFAPQVGEHVTITGFPGNRGLYCAISVTLDSTGQAYAFRDQSGHPLWAGGNGGMP